MIIYLQYTICDTRKLTGDKKHLLRKPNWKNIYPFKDFVCSSGQIIPRTKKGINNWIGENYICKINKGIYNIPRINIDEEFKVRCTGKHFFSDGDFLNKYEFVFHIVKSNKELVNFYTYDEISYIVNQILKIKIKIRNTDYGYDLSEIGKSFANLKQLYVNSTTKNKYVSSQKLDKLKICVPQIFIDLQYFDQIIKLPKKVLRSTSNSSLPIDLYGGIELKNNFPYRLWIMDDLKDSSRELKAFRRKVRISCLRVHSEIECIKNICEFIAQNDIKERSLESDLVQKYLNESIKRVSKRKKVLSSYDIAFIDYFIKQVYDEFEPGMSKSVISEIKELKLRKNIENKTINFINNHYGTGDNIAGNKNINK